MAQERAVEYLARRARESRMHSERRVPRRSAEELRVARLACATYDLLQIHACPSILLEDEDKQKVRDAVEIIAENVWSGCFLTHMLTVADYINGVSLDIDLEALRADTGVEDSVDLLGQASEHLKVTERA